MLKEDKAGITYAKGFKAAGIKAGIKKSGNPDLALIVSDNDAAVAGTFTQNKVAAAPVYVSKKVVSSGSARAIIANSGCANACTGQQGMDDAKKTAELTASQLGIEPDDVVVASTGVIGVTLPMDKIQTGIKTAAAVLKADGSEAAASAIITTDTYIKSLTTSMIIDGKEVRIGAIAKGAGMIQPNMATMLCFITTDANIDQVRLQLALSEIVEKSFNMISVDGDMSTNDMAVIFANGQAGNKKIVKNDADFKIFYDALSELCCEMAQKIAADGEGATKFLTINIHNAENFADAKKIGMSIANSPLVKTAFFGQDPNWGRVLCAAGYAGANMIPEKTVVKFGNITVYENGTGASFDKKALQKIMAEHDIIIDIDLSLGSADATVWTCDLSYEYVKINGEYHT
ncbi:bifunctional glutamate N-acetyltransferase/amino-acid acetyltransferase ArgJ [Pectinatus haikarae]|uniref:Arginine biosynthesis bifunctional protein ArgJ n=1 Tax=Pectinatus haikarae TaxID=349096 RepID=A0ABT9Y496_9FIRM|nr:bifunctional glutamate N-acetyltransferase/amino-acid acetyltransferase ArgJ [Pectinatus haikarae]MDQ0202654.1 glutamate N-acetyltransferase/amino-acid N-acetyltransferase [Pectinatus haikarae]